MCVCVRVCVCKGAHTVAISSTEHTPAAANVINGQDDGRVSGDWHCFVVCFVVCNEVCSGVLWCCGVVCNEVYWRVVVCNEVCWCVVVL